MKLPKRHMAAGFLLAFFSYTLADGVFNLALADDEGDKRAATREVIRQSTDYDEQQVYGAAEAVIESDQEDEETNERSE